MDHEEVERALTEPHVGPMQFTGRPMRGFVEVEAAGVDDDADLAHWIDTGCVFAASLPPK
jgi:hypothetical protein